MQVGRRAREVSGIVSYVADKRTNKYKVCDSDTGKVFEVGYNKIGYFCNGKLFDMSTVMGYCKNGIHVVSKELAGLVGYIKNIKHIAGWYYDTGEDTSILVCSSSIFCVDSNRLFITTNLGENYDILDVIMCASYDKSFNTWVTRGVVPCSFAGRDCLAVTLCGDYMIYLSKLLTIYRKKWEEAYNIVDTKDGSERVVLG